MTQRSRRRTPVIIWIATWCLMLLTFSPGLALVAPDETEEANAMRSKVWRIDDVERAREAAGRAYHEFLEVPALSAGLYALAAGAEDKQSPHERDEVYYVIEGRAEFVSEDRRDEVAAGAVIYVKRHVEHRFENITEDLSILVLFAGE